MTRYFRIRSMLPGNRAGLGTFLWTMIGYWHEVDSGKPGLLKVGAPKMTGICAMRLGGR